jgi:hypothetical protein
MIASQVDPLTGTQNSYSLGSVHSAPVSALKLLPQECAIRVCVFLYPAGGCTQPGTGTVGCSNQGAQ